jgi:hypothetical protein
MATSPRSTPLLGAAVFAAIGSVPIWGYVLYGWLAYGPPSPDAIHGSDPVVPVILAAGAIFAVVGALFGYRIGQEAAAGRGRRVVGLTLLYPVAAFAVIAVMLAIVSANPADSPFEVALVAMIYLGMFALLPLWAFAGLAAWWLYRRTRRAAA